MNVAFRAGVVAGLVFMSAQVGFVSSVHADDVDVPEKIVDTMEVVFGKHEGMRRNHIKGICTSGHFSPSEEASVYTKSPLFAGGDVSVLVRFSVPGGNPNVSDAARIPRGMAIHFQSADGDEQNMTMLNVPVFGAATPRSFLESFEAKIPDPKTGKPDPEKVKAYIDTHPDAKPQMDYLKDHNPPESYASAQYFGIHTFMLENAEGKEQPVRWSFVPKDGVVELSDTALEALPKNFLEGVLKTRFSQGPVQWDMVVSLGRDGDTLTNPTIQWPDDRQKVTFGTLVLDTMLAGDHSPCEEVNFDPMVMTEGFDSAGDPVLEARSPAYAISSGRRLSERE